MKLSFSDLSVGLHSKRSFYFTEERVRSFAELVDDHAPVHVDTEFAKELGFESRIVHGLFVQSIVSGILGNEVPGARSVINQINMKMHSPVLIGDTVDYELEITALTQSVRAVSLSFSGKVKGNLIISGKAICSFPI